jgi:hypothetical protein
MLIIGHLKEWYDIIPRRWLFLEAGEAKTAIDSHYTQVKMHVVNKEFRHVENVEKK